MFVLISLFVSTSAKPNILLVKTWLKLMVSREARGKGENKLGFSAVSFPLFPVFFSNREFSAFLHVFSGPSHCRSCWDYDIILSCSAWFSDFDLAKIWCLPSFAACSLDGIYESSAHHTVLHSLTVVYCGLDCAYGREFVDVWDCFWTKSCNWVAPNIMV